MLSFLTNLSIRNKLILMLVFPIAGLAYFAIVGMMERQELAAEMAKVESLSELAVKASALVHETQKERGMTAGYLGSQGEKFRSDLPAQRSKTDERYSALREFVDSMDEDDVEGAAARNLSSALRDLERLSSMRQQVTSLSAGLGEALDYYTGINSALLSVVSDLTKLTDQGQVTRRIGAYVNLLQAKERAGIERAVLANTFAADRFAPGMFNRFSALVAAQDTYTQAFEALATSESKSYFRDAMENDYVREVKRMRRVAFDKAGAGNFDIDAGYWFEQQTGRINLLKGVEDKLAEDLKAVSAELRSAARAEFVLFMGLAAVASGFAVLLAFFMTRAITRPLTMAVAALHDIAEGEGDLTRRLQTSGRDEVAQLAAGFNKFADKIQDLVGQIKEAAESINTSSSEISAGNTNLSQRTEEQASSLEETASSMEEMTSTVKQNADNANQASQLATGAREHAEKGGEVVSNAVSAMDAINASSKKIVDIISVIDEIAFQTNLLALNAAVEAARAGEQGRGFAVVAGEVRNLAQRSAEAAKEIKDLIQDSVGKIQQGSELVNASGQTLDEIVVSVKKVTDIVSEIAAASQEQSSGIEQVNKAVMQMDEMTQQNAALVEEAAAASRSLDEQAEGLAGLVRQFKVDDRGRATPRAAPQARAPEPPAPAQRSMASAGQASTPRSSARAGAPKAKQAEAAAGQTARDDEWSEF